jgi:hypothetical protein
VVARRRVPVPPVLAGALGVAGVVVALAVPARAPEAPARAVLDLFAARASGSCADYVATTTPFFRNDPYLGSPTCADVAADAAELAARGPFEVEVVGLVQVDVDTAEVETVERYRVGTAEEYAIAMAYRTQLVDGAWAVDHVDLTVLPD